MANTACSKWPLFSPPNRWHFSNFSFKGHPVLIFAQGSGGRNGCASRLCPRLSPIIHFPLRFVLLTCPKIAEMGWPLNLLGGQCVSRRHLPQHQCHTRPLIYLAGKWLYCRWRQEAPWGSGVSCSVHQARSVDPERQSTSSSQKCDISSRINLPVQMLG